MWKIFTASLLPLLLSACFQDEKNVSSIMNIETLHVQKGFFEKEYGPAKRFLHNTTYQYQVDKCLINVKYDSDNAIEWVQLENISPECTFNAEDILLNGKAHNLTYKDLVAVALDWQAKISCYAGCGNAEDPSYGMMVQTPRVHQMIEYDADSNYQVADKASEEVRKHFSNKYPEILLSGGDLAPISVDEYNKVWIDKFKDVKITSIKFGYNLKQ